MELFDLYTADRQKTGKTMVRGTRTPEGYYRLVVHICIFDGMGRMLIQKRQPFKQGWSGLWDISVGGAAQMGDTSERAAWRETHEELGLDLDFSGLRPSLTLYWEHGFDDYYIITHPVDPDTLTLQKEEVEKVRWATLDEILKLIDEGLFIPYEKSLMELLFARQNRQSAHTRADWTVPQET